MFRAERRIQAVFQDPLQKKVKVWWKGAKALIAFFPVQSRKRWREKLECNGTKGEKENLKRLGGQMMLSISFRMLSTRGRGSEKTKEQGLERDDGEKVCFLGSKKKKEWCRLGVGGGEGFPTPPPWHNLSHNPSRHNDKSACQPNTVQQDGLAFEQHRLSKFLEEDSEELIFVSGR